MVVLTFVVLKIDSEASGSGGGGGGGYSVFQGQDD